MILLNLLNLLQNGMPPVYNPNHNEQRQFHEQISWNSDVSIDAVCFSRCISILTKIADTVVDAQAKRWSMEPMGMRSMACLTCRTA